MRQLALSLGLAAFTLVGAPASAETITGASRIIDGDSLEVAGRKIDLLGVDAPELGQTCKWPKKEINCGLIAKSALMDLTAGVSVVCELAAGDRGGNALGVCRAAGYDLAEGMTHTGWAVAIDGAPQRYKTAMAGAQEARRALWHGQFTLPWIWRAQEGEAGQ
ncbi:thermonuclease family protein [Denitrobaculum tricleocarpae]|nr:thermonuclease family protein [Denitrobaculum tricleocarpae]